MEYRSGIITLSVIALLFAVMFYFAPDQADVLRADHRNTGDGAAISMPALQGNLLGLIFLIGGLVLSATGLAAILLLARHGRNGLSIGVLALMLGTAGFTLLAAPMPVAPSSPRVTPLLAYFDGLYVYTGYEVRNRTSLCMAQGAQAPDCLEALAYMEERATILDLRAASIMVACLALPGFLVASLLFPRSTSPRPSPAV